MRGLKFIMPAVALLLIAAVANAQAPKSDTFKAADGTKIRYLTLGDQGSWVVLIHGFTDSAQRMWFTTGIAPELAKKHRIVAIDMRGHGQSEGDRMADSAPDVIELMNLLKIEKAHIHGYSMGGMTTTRLLANHPEKFLTAGFGGSGISDPDPDAAAKAREADAAERAKAPAAAATGGRGGRGGARGRGDAGAAAGNARAGAGRGEGAARGDGAARGEGAARAGGGRGGAAGMVAGRIDLAKANVPIIFINGSLDSPHSRSSRALREHKAGTLKADVKEVILDGHTHMTAIAVGGQMPKEYITEMSKFIDDHDQK